MISVSGRCAAITQPGHHRRVPAPRSSQDGQGDSDQSFGLDELDPVRLGRKSRQAFDDLWTQFATLASPTRSFSERDLYQDAVFEADPEARRTKVLVVGAVGRTGGHSLWDAEQV